MCPVFESFLAVEEYQLECGIRRRIVFVLIFFLSQQSFMVVEKRIQRLRHIKENGARRGRVSGSHKLSKQR